jgi:hypothetical protein
LPATTDNFPVVKEARLNEYEDVVKEIFKKWGIKLKLDNAKIGLSNLSLSQLRVMLLFICF